MAMKASNYTVTKYLRAPRKGNNYTRGELWDMEFLDGENFDFVCYAPRMITTSGVWRNDNPFDFSLPLFITQLSVIFATTQILISILKRFRQPRIVGQILAGLLLGPSGIGRYDIFARLFPMRSIMVLQTMANVGLLYFLFLVGVETDLNVIIHTTKKPLIIAIASMIVPFIVVVSSAFYTMEIDFNAENISYYIYFAIIISITASPVLGRILADLKLFNTNIGKLAMSVAFVNDVCAWILLLIATIIIRGLKDEKIPKFMGFLEGHISKQILVIFNVVTFVLVYTLVIRPSITWVIKRKPDGENFKDFFICLILAGVMASGFITDVMGTHYIFGAFFFGLIIPSGPLGVALVEKIEDFINVFLLPLYFCLIGLRTDIQIAIQFLHPYPPFVAIIGPIGKAMITFLIALIYDMPFRDGLSLAMLINSKGVMELIILDVAMGLAVIRTYGYSMMVLIFLGMTIIITPTLLVTYKPGRRIIINRCRTIQTSAENAELRVLVAVHNPRNVPTMINLLHDSHPNENSPMCIYAVHLVELTNSASSMLVVHYNTFNNGRNGISHTQAQSEQIVNVFENFAQETKHVTVLPLTVVSRYSTMHQDICNLAEDKQINFIIVPFHKQQTVDGEMEASNLSFRSVNLNVLDNAPCSVGILIDRGLPNLSINHLYHNIAMLFFGGRDDREALAYAWRMAQHPYVNLTVLRFLQGDHPMVPNPQETTKHVLKDVIKKEREKKLDDEYINDLRSRFSNNGEIEYKENAVYGVEEVVATIRKMDNTHDLYIIGRRKGVISPLTTGLVEWSECPELGAIGDLMASSDFTTASVLVVQQYI